jgi:cob(I)alamin adenosyltransferase
MRKSRIYTRKGDKGRTMLSNGRRVDKDNQRIEAYGTVDELNSLVGLASAADHRELVGDVLAQIQNDLFLMGTDLSTPQDEGAVAVQRVNEDEISALERLIDEYDSKLPPLRNFILPGGSSLAAALHVCRSVCRRAEREAVRLAGTEQVNPCCAAYLNRLSDLLFVLARYANKATGTAETVLTRKSDKG